MQAYIMMIVILVLRNAFRGRQESEALPLSRTWAWVRHLA